MMSQWMRLIPGTPAQTPTAHSGSGMWICMRLLVCNLSVEVWPVFGSPFCIPFWLEVQSPDSWPAHQWSAFSFLHFFYRHGYGIFMWVLLLQPFWVMNADSTSLFIALRKKRAAESAMKMLFIMQKVNLWSLFVKKKVKTESAMKSLFIMQTKLILPRKMQIQTHYS